MAVPEGEMMTVQEAAGYLGVSRFKLARLIRDGELTTYTTPLDRRQRLVRRRDLDALKGRYEPSEGTQDTHAAA